MNKKKLKPPEPPPKNKEIDSIREYKAWKYRKDHKIRLKLPWNERTNLNE